jgi:ribosome-associated protein
MLSNTEITRSIVTALEDKKGENILLMDISEISSFADFFILCNGTSDRMLISLADGLMDMVKKEFHLHPRLEGKAAGGWMVLDIGDIVIHLFSPEQREYYNLEELWEKGKVLLRLN